MSTMLQRMKANFKAKQTGGQDPAIFTFWNMKTGSSAILRFVPYNDPNTGGYWAEKKTVPMRFVDPNDDSKFLRFQAPCREMYDRSKTCPVLDKVRAVYSEAKENKNAGRTKHAEQLEKLAGKHWLSLTCYYQGFVIKAGMEETNVPENPIRIFPFTKKIHKLIYDTVFENEEEPFEKLPSGEFTVEDVQSLLNDNLSEDQATHIMEKLVGYNFRLNKAQQGEFADWTRSSGWMRSQPAQLTDEQIAAIAEYGFHDLTLKLPARPTDEQYDVMAEMIDVSLANGEWNPEWEEAGLKPYREKQAGGGSGGDEDTGASKSTSVGGGLASRLQAIKKQSSAPADDETSEEQAAPASKTSVLAQINAKRATVAKAAEPVEEAAEPVEPEAAAAEPETVEEAAPAPKKTDVAALAARIRNKVANKG